MTISFDTIQRNHPVNPVFNVFQEISRLVNAVKVLSLLYIESKRFLKPLAEHVEFDIVNVPICIW